jgi:hypothetical protein
MQVKTIDLLRDVRKTLSNSTKWTTGGYARDSAGHETDACDEVAVSWCGQGAIYACGSARGMPTLRQVMCDDESGAGSDWARALLDSLDIIAARFGFDGFIDANDNGGRAEALRVIDSAIAELEREASHETNQSPQQSHPARRTAEGRHRVVGRVQTRTRAAQARRRLQ